MRKAVILVLVLAVALADVGCAANPNPVDWADLGVFAEQWLAEGSSANGWGSGADLNHSGRVDFADFSLFAQHWLKQSPAYYVAPYGNDDNPGTLMRPFRTIQKAADVMQPGDTCYIREGRYHEEVVINNISGTEEAPIAFLAYPAEMVTLDGTESITGNWTLHNGNIYKTTLTKDIWQLFVDGKMMTLARFPNALAWSDLWWDRNYGWRWEAEGATNGHMIDDETNGGPDTLTGQGVSFNGCVAVMNLRNWNTYARIVQNHTAGTDNFDYDPAPHYTDTRGRYFIEGFAALDMAEEWFYKQTTKTLYLWADDGQNPTGRNIRGKTQTYAFDVSNSSYITIDGLNFFATTFKFDGCSYSTIENCALLYPSYSKRTLGSIESAEPTTIKNGDHDSICNCTFEYIDGCGVYVKPSNFATVENCYFHYVDYSCLAEGYTFNFNKSHCPIFRRNTIDTSGDSEGLRLGGYGAADDPLVELNFFIRMGLLQTDGSSIQIGPDNADGSISRYNWFYELNRTAIRFDGDPGGNYGAMHRNVVLGAMRGLNVKGDYHNIYNNTAMDCSPKNDIAINVIKGGNEHTITRNNAANKLSGHAKNWEPIPGTHSNNWNGYVTGLDIRTHLRDPDNWDFRPKAGSDLIDAGYVIPGVTDDYLGSAPDIGAYEYGDPNYWIPGCKFKKASCPIPPDGSTTVKLDADLMWLQGRNALSHDVYFGTDYNSVADANHTCDEYKCGQTNNIFDPCALNNDTWYYWRIDALDANGNVKTHGDTWSFTTGSAVTSDLQVISIDH